MSEDQALVERSPEGIRLRLDRPVAEFLLRFPDMLDETGADADDPAGRRLQPPVYLDDEEADEEWWGFMRDELERSRQEDRARFREVMEKSVDGVVVDTEGAHALLRVLVESRLALAARLGIEEEGDYSRLAEPEAAVLDSLGRLQVALLAALVG